MEERPYFFREFVWNTIMQNDTLFREDIIHLAEDLIYQLMCDSASDQGITFYALYHLIGISGVLLDIVYDPTFGNISEYYFIQHIDKGFGWFFQPPTYLEDIFVNNNTFPNMQLTYDIVFVNYMNLHILMIPPNVLRVVSIVLYDYAQFYMFSDSWYLLDGILDGQVKDLILDDANLSILYGIDNLFLYEHFIWSNIGVNILFSSFSAWINLTSIQIYIQGIAYYILKFIICCIEGSFIDNDNYILWGIWTLQYFIGTKLFILCNLLVLYLFCSQLYLFIIKYAEYWIEYIYLRFIEKRLYRLRLYISLSYTWNDIVRQQRKFLLYALYAINSQVQGELVRHHIYKYLGDVLEFGFIWQFVRFWGARFPFRCWEWQVRWSVMGSAYIGRIYFMFLWISFFYITKVFFGILIRYAYVFNLLHYFLYLSYYIFFWIKEDVIQPIYYDFWALFVKIDNWIAMYSFQDYHYSLLQWLGPYIKPNQIKYYDVETFETHPAAHSNWFNRFFDFFNFKTSFPLLNFNKVNMNFIKTFIWILLNICLILPLFYLSMFFINKAKDRCQDFYNFILVDFIYYQIKLFISRFSLGIELKLQWFNLFIIFIIYYFFKWILVLFLVFFLMHFFVYSLHKTTYNFIWCTPKYICWLVGFPFYGIYYIIRFMLYSFLYVLLSIILRPGFKFLVFLFLMLFLNFKIFYISWDFYYYYIYYPLQTCGDIILKYTFKFWDWTSCDAISWRTYKPSNIVTYSVITHDGLSWSFIQWNNFIKNAISYTHGKDPEEVQLKAGYIPRIKELEIYTLAGLEHFTLLDPNAKNFRFWFSRWETTRWLLLRYAIFDLARFFFRYHTLYCYYLDSVHWFYKRQIFAWKFYWWFYTFWQMFKFIICDISLYSFLSTWLYLMPLWFGGYLSFFWFIKIYPYIAYIKYILYNSWSLYYLRALIYNIVSLIKYVFWSILLILLYLYNIFSFIYISYFEAIYIYNISYTFLPISFSFVSTIWKAILYLFSDLMYYLLKRLPVINEYLWQQIHVGRFEGPHWEWLHKFRIVRFKLLLFFNTYFRTQFDLFNSYSRIDYHLLYDDLHSRAPHYNVRRYLHRARRWYRRYRFGERLTNSSSLIEWYADMGYLDFYRVRRFSRPMTNRLTLQVLVFGRHFRKHVLFFIFVCCICHLWFLYWIFSPVVSRTRSLTGLYHPQYLWTLFREKGKTNSDFWLDDYFSIEALDSLTDKFTNLEQIVNTKINYSEYQRRDDMEALFGYSEAGKINAQYNAKGKKAIHLIREFTKLSELIATIRWFKKCYKEDLLKSSKKSKYRLRQLKTRLKLKIEDITVLKEILLTEMHNESYLKVNKRAIFNFERAIYFDYGDFVMDDGMSHFYNLYRTWHEKLSLLIARGYRRDPYFNQLVWLIDEEEQVSLDPSWQELNIKAYRLSEKIWDFSYNLSKVFGISFPDWVWHKDHVTPTIFESNREMFGQTLFTPYEEEFIFDGSFVIVFWLPFLLVLQILRFNYSFRGWWVNHSERVDIAFLFKLYFVNNVPLIQTFIHNFPYGGWANASHIRYFGGNAYADEWFIVYGYLNWPLYDPFYNYSLANVRSALVWIPSWPDFPCFQPKRAESNYFYTPPAFFHAFIQFLTLCWIWLKSLLLTVFDFFFFSAPSSISTVQYYYYKWLKIIFVIFALIIGLFKKETILNNNIINLNMDIIAYIKKYAKINAIRWNLYFSKKIWF